MERLVTTAQAAEILGISLQGVHYRIKKNQLKAIKQASKTYVYINNSLEKTPVSKHEEVKLEPVLEVKNEQIKFLKKSIKSIKKDHKKELERLVNSHESSMSVLHSEVKLLQSAFNEMKIIYKNQLEYKINLPKNETISLEHFFKKFRSYNKSNKEIKELIIKAINENDFRFKYNKKTKQMIIKNVDFTDLI